MARKLISGNDVVGFNASNGTITINGYVPLSKLLLINNATLNTILYNFSDPNLTATCATSGGNSTVITLTNYNSSNYPGISNTDKIQIYYEKEELEIKPTRTYRDPVSKFRVSTPETLIDTDFEYGLQPTKWETLKLVNNVPTSYSSVNPEDALLVTNVEVADGGNLVTVTTVTNHGLVTGSIIEIVGLTNPAYEGNYIVSVGNSNTFTYKVPFNAKSKQTLYTIYTLVYPGAFYTGSSVDIDDVSTDQATPSTLTLTTPYYHGFNENTKLFLKKSRAITKANFLSPDNVVADATTSYSSTVNSTTTSPISDYYSNKPLIFDDYIGDFEINLDNASLNDGTGKISYALSNQIGPAKTTPIQTGDVVVFYTPTGNNLPGIGAVPIQRFTPFYVINSTTTNGIVTFTVSQVYGSTTVANITVSAGGTTYGNHRFFKGFKINTVTAKDVVSCASSTTFAINDSVVAISTYPNGNAGLAGGNFVFTRTLGQQNITVTNFQQYTITSLSGIGQTFTIKENINTNTSGSLDFTPANRAFIALVKLKNHPLANSVYIPQSAGFSTTPFYDGFYAKYTCPYPNSVIGGISSNTSYYLTKITGYPNWYNLHDQTDTTLGKPLPLYFSNDSFVQNVYNGPHTFGATIDRDDQHTIAIISPVRGNFTTNDNVVYSTTVNPIGNLVSTQSYKVNSSGPSLNATQLRLTSTSGITSIHSIAHKAGDSTAIINVYTSPTSTPYPSLTNCGISVGSYIQISGFDASMRTDGVTLNTLYQGLHKVTAIGATSKNVCALTVQVPSWKNITNALTISPTAQDILRTTSVTGIITFTSVGGTGTHVLTKNNDGATDDLYFIKSKTDKTFVFNTDATIPNIVKNISAVSTGTSATSSLQVFTHNFADGTKVTYSTNTTAIGGLTNNTDYYIRVLDANFVALSATADGATNRESTDLLIALSSFPAGSHSFTTNSVKGFLTGVGKIGFTSTSNTITGTNTRFFTDFSNGDLFRIYKLTNTGTGPGTYFESKVTSVKSDTVLKLENNPLFADTSSNYFVPTRLYAISDGKAVHRPYDGGVSMTTGLVPNTQVIRQTRKYFRYQSGKGIQVSKAINFNPTFDIDLITNSNSDGSTATVPTTYYTINTKFPHQISSDSVGTDQKIKIKNAKIGDSADNFLNTGNGFAVTKVIDDFNFVIDAGASANGQIGGFPQFCVVNWQGATVKCGMFDDQNGFFFKYNGSTLYAVRRSSTQQLSGVFSVERNSHTVTGFETKLVAQIKPGDRIVIRGQTYKVTQVSNDNTMDVQPAYRGGTTSNIIVSKVQDTEIPQSQWNLDKMDGTGESGYNIDINKIQMIYIDYSWYGAGSIRFGFKDQYGEVRYCHEFVHNNSFTESYFRSGNIPARYEVETGNSPLFAPSLFHWGVSVIMDGRFDDDKAYLFTAESNSLPFTNGGFANKGGGTNTDGRPNGTVAIGSNVVTLIDKDEAAVLAVGETIVDSASATTFPTGTTISSIQIDQTTDANKYQNTYSLTVSNNATANGSKTFNVYSGTSAALQSFIPLVSIRLAPAVDNATVSNLGYRDIITRMQLTLKSAGVLTSHDCEVRLVFNSKLSNDNFANVGSPSLSQIYKHQVGDTYSGGTVVYAFRAQGGSVTNTTTGRRSLNGTDVSLAELALLGNSILGGDGVYPDGPDIITVAVKPVDTSQITGSSPFLVTGRITWSEAQA